MWNTDQEHEKLARYRLEAEVYRQLPRRTWRRGAAQLLRGLAERLEPGGGRPREGLGVAHP
jgi:hypothetical protein